MYNLKLIVFCDPFFVTGQAAWRTCTFAQWTNMDKKCAIQLNKQSITGVKKYRKILVHHALKQTSPHFTSKT